MILFSGNLEPGREAAFIDVYSLELATNLRANATATQLKTGFWMMDLDGSNKNQITWFNDPRSFDYQATGVVCADSSWNADETKLAACVIDGRGVAAAYIQRVAGSGSQSLEPVQQCTGGAGTCSTLGVDLGPSSDQVYLVLSGTGIRGRRSLTDVLVTVGGQSAEVLFAGPQFQYPGFGRLAVRLPGGLMGVGVVHVLVRIADIPANPVQVELRWHGAASGRPTALPNGGASKFPVERDAINGHLTVAGRPGGRGHLSAPGCPGRAEFLDHLGVFRG